MSPKILRYVLISGVTLVWGVIIYRIVSGMGDNENYIVTSIPVQSAPSPQNDSFFLYANYPDPFLGDASETEDSTNDPGNMLHGNLQPIPTRPPKPDMSFLEYRGLIQNIQKKTRVAIVRIRDKEVMVKEKDEVEGVLFRRITKDKITVLYNGYSTEIRKNF